LKVYTNISDFEIKNSALTIGVFDGVHNGHLSVLGKLKAIAVRDKCESVVFTFWPHPRMVLQTDNANIKLLNTIDEKISLLKKTGIDHLIIFPFTLEFSKLSSCEFISKILAKKLQISKLVIGFNHHFGHNREGSFEDLVKCVEESNLLIERLEPFTVNSTDISSTYIRKALFEGRLSEANNLLGYNYILTGKVVKGSQIGRSIGFPTANIKPDSSFKLIPKDGVYAVKVNYNGNEYNGMLNIGIRPTIKNKAPQKSIEVHIFNFNNVIYNSEISVSFISRVRDEIKFDNINDLKNQLEKDRLHILNILDN